MASTVTANVRHRDMFGKIKKVVEIPHLIELQRKSYDHFLQARTAPDEREEVGLHGVFNSVFPIKDFKEIILHNIYLTSI